MQPWPQQSLPFQHTRVQADRRPQTSHAAPSYHWHAGQSNQPNQRAPEGALAGLGVVPESLDLTASSDNAVSGASALMPAPPVPANGSLRPTRSEQNLDYRETNPPSAPTTLDPSQHLPLAAPRAPRRRSTFRLASFSQGQTESSAAHSNQKPTASLGRRFSKQYKDRMSDLKENMSGFGGRIRRSSTPQTVDAASHVSKPGYPAPPTSPSKRNGKQQESDRPAKLNRGWKQTTNDRKDTPAPGSSNAAGRKGPPALSLLQGPPAPTIMPGGDRARQAAAAAAKVSSQWRASWDCQEDLNRRRNRVGSLSSAADSGADLSSNVSHRDADGDVEMTSTQTRPLDPLQALPSEISLQIFEFLDARDLVNVEAVNTEWRTTALKTCVWRNAFLREYQRHVHTDPPPVQVGGAGVGRPNRPNQEWKKMYQARVELERNWRKGAKGAGKAVYLSGHTDSVYCLQFDEEKIITGSRDRTIRVWDINNFTCIRVIGGPSVKPSTGPKVLRTVDYPDFHLATASVNGTAYGDAIFSTPSQWHDASILCLQYDEKILVTGSSDSDLIVWDIHTYEPITRLQKHTGGVLDVALDADHIISCSKDSRIIVWDRKTYESRGELTGHRGPVNAVQLRGKYLVSASGDGIARLWDIHAMKLVKEFGAKERGLAAVEFSEDMRHVLAGGNDTITYKFETETGKEVAQFSGHSQLVRSLWLDSQNSRVVSGSYDLDLRVYDFATGDEIWRAEEWTTSWMLAAKSDYRRIVATSQDGRILIVDFGLQKGINPDDGQPLPGVDALRGTDKSSAIQWRDPWEMDRERARKERRHRRDLDGREESEAREREARAAVLGLPIAESDVVMRE